MPVILPQILLFGKPLRYTQLAMASCCKVFYRRKILLALIETFGGLLTITDCQVLLLLFCKRREKNFYDFFPHSNGAQSFLLEQDKNRLTALDFLSQEEHFHFTAHQSFISQLKALDRIFLQALFAEVSEMRGEKLAQKVYNEFPYYMSRNPLAKELFEKENQYKDITPAFYTLGYEGLSIDAYINLLLRNNIASLVDVRKNPLSMKYGFSKTKLADYVSRVGISYFHLPELGIPSALRRDLDNSVAYDNLFDYYYREILPKQEEAIKLVKLISQEYGRIALTCFETNHQFCHRQKLVAYLKEDIYFDLPVIHLQNSSTTDTFVEYTNNREALPHSSAGNVRYSYTR